jgi:hypothetical protein
MKRLSLLASAISASFATTAMAMGTTGTTLAIASESTVAIGTASAQATATEPTPPKKTEPAPTANKKTEPAPTPYPKTQPAKPTATEPAKPTTTEPAKPTTTEPAKPTTTEPAKPTTTEPAKPTTTEPAKPTTTEPAKPTTTEPAAPSAMPPAAPSIYDNGPTSFQVSATDLSAAERAAYALYEGILQVAEARILATSCASLAGTYDVKVFANGNTGDASSNEVTISSPGGVGSFTLRAALSEPDSFRGQQIQVSQQGAGSLKGTSVDSYTAAVTFNQAGTLMVADSSVNVMGVNGRADAFQGRVIKDFYRQTNPTNPDDSYIIFDWGLQSVFKLGYPVNKYWQRSQSLRDDGGVGRTVFVKDRLVGATSCRLVLNTTGSNNEEFFLQNGTLTVAKVKPNTPVAEFDFGMGGTNGGLDGLNGLNGLDDGADGTTNGGTDGTDDDGADDNGAN